MTRHEDRLRRVVAFRLDQRLQGRIDPSAVIQEVYVEVSQHLPEYQKQESLPFFCGFAAWPGISCVNCTGSRICGALEAERGSK